MSRTPSTDSAYIDYRPWSPRRTWWLLGLGASLRIIFFLASANSGGDALARAASTAAWLQHPSLKFFFGRYLPLHFWLIGTLTLLVRNVVLAGRLLSLALGIASLFLVWTIARALYDEEAANLSLLAFSFYSLHIAYSAASSSEVPYLFFVLVGLASFFVYRRSGNVWLLGLGGIALSLGAAIRYEAWVVIFALVSSYPFRCAGNFKYRMHGANYVPSSCSVLRQAHGRLLDAICVRRNGPALLLH